MRTAPRDGRRLVALVPALIIPATALFALPQQAGGYRLAKWGSFGFALAALGVILLVARTPLRLPQRWLGLAGFTAAALVLPAFSSALAPTHWPTSLSLLSGCALFFGTVMALGDDDDARRASLIVLTATGALCAVVVLLQTAGLRWLTSDVYTSIEFRAPGTFGNPNWAAAFLAPLVPLSLGLATTAQRRWPHLACSALLSIATLATLSKGGVLTLAAGVVAYVLLNRDVPGRWRIAMLVGLAACGALAFALAWHQVLFTQASWLRGRLFLWRVALYLVGERPLTGVGLGGYPPAYGRGAAALIDGDANAFVPLSTIDFAHNDVLQFAAEGGLITAAAFIALVVSAIASTYRQSTPLSRASSAAIAAIFVNGLADAPMRVPSTVVLFFFLLGWLSPSAPGPSGRRPLLTAIVLLGMLQGLRFTAGNAFWTLGREALRDGRPAIAYLERARFFLPEYGRIASHFARSLARAGQVKAALDASAVAATLQFDFDDEIFRRDLRARSLDRAEALEDWHELSARFPMLVTPYLRLGALHLQANDRAAAITAYETVLANPQPTEHAERARTQARDMLRSLLSKTQ